MKRRFGNTLKNNEIDERGPPKKRVKKDKEEDEESENPKIDLLPWRKEGLCLLCCDRPREVIFFPCGHSTICEICANKLEVGIDETKVYKENEFPKCPWCTKTIHHLVYTKSKKMKNYHELFLENRNQILIKQVNDLKKLTTDNSKSDDLGNFMIPVINTPIFNWGNDDEEEEEEDDNNEETMSQILIKRLNDLEKLTTNNSESDVVKNFMKQFTTRSIFNFGKDEEEDEEDDEEDDDILNLDKDEEEEEDDDDVEGFLKPITNEIIGNFGFGEDEEEDKEEENERISELEHKLDDLRDSKIKKETIELFNIRNIIRNDVNNTPSFLVGVKHDEHNSIHMRTNIRILDNTIGELDKMKAEIDEMEIELAQLKSGEM